MGNFKKIPILVVIFTIISFSILNIFTTKTYAISQSISTDIESLDENLYPGIKEKIKTLKSQYPNWNFKILYTNIEWSEVIANEYVGHNTSPRNLIYNSSNYQEGWICNICEQKTYDNGNWHCASEQAIKYMMDPRNLLNTSEIFQLEELTYNGCDSKVISSMTKDTFLQNYSEKIAQIAKDNGINPYYIVARLIQEQGKSGSKLTEGTGYDGKYIGYYNAFNIGASGNTKEQVIINGLAYAEKQGWTTLESSINGGISFLAKEYIKAGQNTLYLQKFDVESQNNGLYWHQYMQNLTAAQTEGTTLRDTYINMNAMNSEHTFIIPVYKNMPSKACEKPNETSGNTITTDLVKVNVDSSLRLRNEPNGDKTVGWIYTNEIVTRIEKATTKLNGTYWDKVQKSDGTIGYAARQTYDSEAKYKLYLVPVNETNNESIKKGDVNGDGQISPGDYVLIKNYILGSISLNDAQRKAADVNGDGQISPGDYVLVKNNILYGTTL